MAKTRSYYKPIPGSRDLLTRSPLADEQILRIEKELDKAQELGPLFQYDSETLGGVSLKGKSISIPEEILDKFMAELEPVEQCVYLQLFRLSYAKSKNFCRVGKKELAKRANLSLLRLNSGLMGLARKNLIKPIHRSIKGTLWRVYHPAELGKKVNYEIELGKKIEIKVEKPKPEKPLAPPKPPLESPITVDRLADLSKDKPQIPLRKIAERFFELKNKEPSPEEMDDTIAVITGLLEDGFSRKQVILAIEWFTKKFPKEKNLSRLPYYITRALEEDNQK